MSVSETREERFISDGFSNWRNALARFEVHDKSNMHLEAVVKVTAMKQGVNVHTQHNLLKKRLKNLVKILHHLKIQMEKSEKIRLKRQNNEIWLLILYINLTKNILLFKNVNRDKNGRLQKIIGVYH